jgi:hypothetical protein
MAVELSSTAPDDAATVELFSIDGRMYTMPANPPAGVILAYLRTLRTQGEEFANVELLETLIGAEAYTALTSCPTLRAEDLRAIMEVVSDHSLGLLRAGGKG